MTYKGYSNYATWSVDQWAHQFENLQEIQSHLANVAHPQDVTPCYCRELVRTLLGLGAMPSLDHRLGRRWFDVDWNEIAEFWAAECRELALEEGREVRYSSRAALDEPDWPRFSDVMRIED